MNFGWFSTGRDEAAIKLLKIVLDAIKKGKIKGDISYLFSNREKGEDKESDKFLDFVDSVGIKIITLSSKKFMPKLKEKGKTNSFLKKKWRILYDREIDKRINQYHVEYIILAGYMLIVGDELCKKYKMINLHPAMPGGPKGSWQEVIWQLIEQKATSSGVMMHLVTPKLDAGPVITYCSYSIMDENLKPLWEEANSILEKEGIGGIKKRGESLPLFMAIRERGLKREFPLIVSTIEILSKNKISFENGVLVDENGNRIKNGYDLSDKIEI